MTIIADQKLPYPIIVGLLSLTTIAAAQPTNVPQWNRAKYLLLDSRIIDTVSGAQLKLGTVTKHPANPMFGDDRPWEGVLDNLYPNVAYDGQADLYKCWYHSDYPHNGLCYAQSKDGLTWKKPALGLVDYQGSKQNNILFAGGGHGVGVWLDHHESNPERRFKMFYMDCRNQNDTSLATRFSRDGIDWSDVNKSSSRPRGDTHNNACWAPTLGKYVGFSRGWPSRTTPSTDPMDDQRVVNRVESTNVLDWSDPEVVFRGIPTRQTYSMPVFFYSGVYLGLPTILQYDNGSRVHVELAWSPDTVNWHRIEPDTPLIPLSETKGDYDWGIIYSAVAPIFLKNEIRVYYAGGPDAHIDNTLYDSSLCLATLRPDGFAGYQTEDEDKAGVVTTNPVTCDGALLRISADAQGGAVCISLLDVEGTAVGQAKPVTADLTDGVISWKDDFELADIRGTKIRLRFELDNAILYSFSFTD